MVERDASLDARSPGEPYRDWPAPSSAAECSAFAVAAARNWVPWWDDAVELGRRSAMLRRLEQRLGGADATDPQVRRRRECLDRETFREFCAVSGRVIRPGVGWSELVRLAALIAGEDPDANAVELVALVSALTVRAAHPTAPGNWRTRDRC